MTNSISKSQLILIFGVPFSLMCFLIILSKSSFFTHHQTALSLGIILDFVITIPITYFLIIRNKKIQKRSVFSVLSIGIILSSIIIPNKNQGILTAIKTWFLPILELGIFIYLFVSVKRTIENYKKNTDSIDFFEALNIATKSVFSTKISRIISVEITTFYYSFFAKNKSQLAENEYTYHKNSGTITILYFFICLILIESSIVHLLVAIYSKPMAWLLTVASVYTAIQFFGFTNAIKKRPIVLEENALKLNYGIFSETKIEYEKIEEIKEIKKFVPSKFSVQLSPLKSFEEPNILVRISKKNIIEKFYGSKKEYTEVAFFIDEKEKFIAEINHRISKV